MLSDKEVYENRLAWAEYLMRPETVKGTGRLDRGDGRRCCLGHGCYFMGIKGRTDTETGRISYDGSPVVAPKSFMTLVGLKEEGGAFRVKQGGYSLERVDIIINDKIYEGLRDLAALNDDTDATPQEIGVYLKSVIMGGEDTPFKEIKIDVG